MKPKLDSKDRIVFINRAINGEKVSTLAKEAQVSRILFYRWLARYNRQGIEGLEPRKRNINRYWRQTPEKYEKVVLSLVEKHPEWGIRTLLKNIPEIAGRPIIGFHGIQNVLRRNDLLTFDKRLGYSFSRTTPITSLISSLVIQSTRFFGLPIDFRQRIIRFVGLMAVSAFVFSMVFGAMGIVFCIFGFVHGDTFSFVFNEVLRHSGYCFVVFAKHGKQ